MAMKPEAVLRARLERADDTCWVAERGGQVCAYLAAYRSALGAVTPLHAVFRPAGHDLYFDLALAWRKTDLKSSLNAGCRS